MQRFDFSEQQLHRVQKRIALSSAYQHDTRAKSLLESLPDEVMTDNAHLWLARIHLRDEDWIGLIRSINDMPDHLKTEAEWTYWLARAYDEAGQADRAQSIYDRLAQRSTYYGFLAADRAQRKYRIMQQQVAYGTFPEEVGLVLERNNVVTQLLARLLDLPAPD